MMGSRVLLGLATVNEPMIRPSRMIGAATCMTLVVASFGSLRVERAPYCPRSVRYTSFQRE